MIAPPEWAKDEGYLAGLTEFEIRQAWKYALTTCGYLNNIGTTIGPNCVFSEIVAAACRFKYKEGLVAGCGVDNAADTSDGEGA